MDSIRAVVIMSGLILSIKTIFRRKLMRVL